MPVKTIALDAGIIRTSYGHSGSVTAGPLLYTKDFGSEMPGAAHGGSQHAVGRGIIGDLLPDGIPD